MHLGVSGTLAISSSEGGECTALVLPRWHYPPAPSTAAPEAPLQEMVDILDASRRVVCSGALIAPDWVLTANACLESAAGVQWGPQLMGIAERVPDPRGGSEAVALLRLEHSVCLKSITLRMDDGANVGAGLALIHSQHSQLPTAKPHHTLIRRLCWVPWELEPFCDGIRPNRRIRWGAILK